MFQYIISFVIGIILAIILQVKKPNSIILSNSSIAKNPLKPYKIAILFLYLIVYYIFIIPLMVKSIMPELLVIAEFCLLYVPIFIWMVWIIKTTNLKLSDVFPKFEFNRYDIGKGFFIGFVILFVFITLALLNYKIVKLLKINITRYGINQVQYTNIITGTLSILTSLFFVPLIEIVMFCIIIFSIVATRLTLKWSIIITSVFYMLFVGNIIFLLPSIAIMYIMLRTYYNSRNIKIVFIAYSILHITMYILDIMARKGI